MDFGGYLGLKILKSVGLGIMRFMKNYDSNATLLENNSENPHNSSIIYKTSKEVELKFSCICEIKILRISK